MKRYRKLVSLVLTVLMVLALLPASLAAEETGTDTAASGVSALPEKYIASGNSTIGSSEPVTGGASINFSENNMLASAYHPSSPYKYFGDPDSGGLPDMATAYYARWDGPVNEVDDPYPNPAFPNSIQYRGGLIPVARISDVVMVPHQDSDASDDINNIKSLVYNRGAAYMSIQYDSANYMNWITHSYYMPQNAVQSKSYGHAVTVVGWDDDYSAANFKNNPGSKGAFIIKNSHGTGGDNGDGYFYISYADKCVGKSYSLSPGTTEYSNSSAVYVMGDSEVESYDHNYQYDPYGYTCAYYFGDDSAYCYMMNVFTASDAQTLKAVSFYTNEYGVQYQVYVVKGTAGGITLPSITSLTTPVAGGTQEDPGYHTVKLNNNVALSAGQKFAVIVKVPGTLYYPYCIEEYTGDEEHLTTGQNESYIYYYKDGRQNWASLFNYGNLCIKAFTVDVTTGGIIESAPVVGGSSISSQLTIGESTNTPDGSEIIPGESSSPPLPGESSSTPGKSQFQSEEIILPRDASLVKRSLIPNAFNNHNEDTPPTGGLEDGFKAGTKLQLYNLYTSRGSDITTGGSLPAKFDLRSKGLITPVKDQGYIGSCWTFAATASAESTYIKTKGVVTRGVTITGAHYVNAMQSNPTQLTADAQSSDEVTSYAWSVTEGSDVLQIHGVLDSAGCTVGYKAKDIEGRAVVTCTVTYSDSTTASAQFSLVVANYGAHIDDPTINNDGSAAHPFEVTTAMGLQLIDCFAGAASQGLNFIQKADINLGYWHPIGDANNPFLGTFDGSDYVINGLSVLTLFINEPVGLFGYVNNSTIKNVKLNNASVNADYSDSISGIFFGGIAGRAQNSTIQDCAVSGNYLFKLTADTNPQVGGLIGNAKDTVLTHCSFSGKIQKTTGEIAAGGLIGIADGATVSNSFANLYASGGAFSAFGGLAAHTFKTSFTDCYATGTFSTPDNTSSVCAGGITREAQNQCSFSNCYASFNYDAFKGSGSLKGAIAAWCDGTQKLSNCYYDKTAAGDGVVLGTFTSAPKGLTAQQMAQQTSFTGFNFTTNWVMAPGPAGYMPVLRSPIGDITEFTFGSEMSSTLFSAQTTQVSGKLSPDYAWPRPLDFTVSDPKILIYNAGIIKAGKYGAATVSVGGLSSQYNMKVVTLIGDVNFDGKCEYNLAVTALLNWLTGKTPTVTDPYVLNADHKDKDGKLTDSDNYSITKEDLSLTDLLKMQQSYAGVNPDDTAG